MELSNFKFRGARAVILLHEYHLSSFFNTWKLAKEMGIKLPITDNPNYKSMEALLVHVLRSAGNYLKWICKNLELDDPGITPVPSFMEVEEKAENYIQYLLDKWRIPLVDIESEKFDLVFENRTILFMMEHALVHPMRHEFQLRELIYS